MEQLTFVLTCMGWAGRALSQYKSLDLYVLNQNVRSPYSMASTGCWFSHQTDFKASMENRNKKISTARVQFFIFKVVFRIPLKSVALIIVVVVVVGGGGNIILTWHETAHKVTNLL